MIHAIISVVVGVFLVGSAFLFVVGLIYFFHDRTTREEYDQYIKNRPRELNNEDLFSSLPRVGKPTMPRKGQYTPPFSVK